jgi:catechol 2,3-dioxygenase-like lactoylglutathione lyase family enzyme
MPIPTLIGLDHVVIVARDLAAAADHWRDLGFTISPRGTHSAHMGTGNHTLMLGEDYLELLGVLTPTERNSPTRALLAEREGIERAALTTTDAAAGVAALQARGIAGEGPIGFERPVDLPDGTRSAAKFETFLWPRDERPGGLRLFACRHFTRDTVWLPHLQRHANTAARIVRVEMRCADPAAAAAHMGRMMDQPPEPIADGFRIATGGRRGAFEFVTPEAFAARHAGVALPEVTTDSALGLVVQAHDVGAAAKAVARAGAVVTGERVTVPPAAANGVVLTFVA